MRYYKRPPNLPHIKNYWLYKAICHAYWLINVHKIGLKGAVSQSTHYYPVKKHIEDYVRKCFPEDYFKNRQKKAFERMIGGWGNWRRVVEFENKTKDALKAANR